MAGIYIHIPFCKQKCSYCDFHFSTNLAGMKVMQQTLLQEIHLRKEEIARFPLRTIYFGGGTPSLWPMEDLNEIIATIEQYAQSGTPEEITLECNPDDLTPEYVSALRHHSRINRLSVGIQSFEDEDLRLMNRAHTSDEARTALDLVFAADFEEITIDLIFGFPGSTLEKWKNQLEKALEYPIRHISCYNLSIENKTALRHQILQGRLTLPEEKEVADQFYLAGDMLQDAGFVHYEISNYGKPGHFAVHNTLYWQNEPYIGIGPSAHSYDLFQRRWNIANNALYIRHMKKGEVYWEEEILQETDRYNEYLLTGLRTIWGVSDEGIEKFSSKLKDLFQNQLTIEKNKGNIRTEEGRHTLTRQGQVLADQVISDFFYV